MTPEDTSDQFEWVSAKAKCTAAVMFERLRAGVKQDVERRNALLRLDDGYRFEFSEEGEAFDVARLEGSRVVRANVAALVRFERAGPRIHVRSEDVDVDFTAILTLDPAGHCRFVVGEALYTDWEVRRMALELLFFDEPDETD
ncbi:MAG TPA: hypothetical protein VFT47_19660 [Vicinamibacterales bacterium]|nr:hypothetical protein [Vicinamibacterales bacterium]